MTCAHACNCDSIFDLESLARSEKHIRQAVSYLHSRDVVHRQGCIALHLERAWLTPNASSQHAVPCFWLMPFAPRIFAAPCRDLKPDNVLLTSEDRHPCRACVGVGVRAGLHTETSSINKHPRAEREDCATRFFACDYM